MGILDNLTGDVTETELSSRSKYFEEGNYILRMTECTEFQPRKGGSIIKLAGEVVATDSTAANHPSAGQEGAKLFSATGDYAQRDLMKFLTGVTGKGLKDLTDAQWKQLASNVLVNNAMRDQYVYLHTETSPQKHDPNKSFTHHHWGVMTDERWAQFGLQAPA